jgi:type IV secretion system protein VirB9
MISSKNVKKNIAALLMAGVLFTPQFSMAASSDADIDALIREQQQRLDELNARKNSQNNDKLAKQIESLQSQLQELKSRKNYDARKDIEALSIQIGDLQKQLARQNELNDRIMQVIERLEKLAEAKSVQEASNSSYSSGGFLVNPSPNDSGVSYTQDAINAQGNSTMTFRYQPNHLYKIYCRTGFITDVALHKGETVNFVGGGDTSAWAINSTTVDGTPHIYIKPVVETSTTNIIITTNKRSYQLIVNTSDWYNPMIRWTYNDEDMAEALAKKKRDEMAITGTMSAKSVSDLHFDYKINGSSDNKPAMVFDDGEKTIIKYNGKLPSKAPAIFIRERGRKGVSLVNFKMKDNCYLLDRVVDQAELRFSDTDVVSIFRKDK